MSQNKVDDGTPEHFGENLCATCSNSHRFRGTQLSQDVLFCHTRGTATPLRITWKVTSCNDYEDKRVPTLWQMEKIAWRFSADGKRKSAGFVTPDEWKKAHPDENGIIISDAEPFS